MNLPQTVVANTSTTTTTTLTYTYDAAGNKLRRKSTGLNNTTDYIAGIQYDGATTPAFSFIQTEEGKAVYKTSTGGFDYVYYLGDNLGNTRITFDTQSGIAVTQQQDDYYPFGMEINTTTTSPKNEYLYNKKELQEETQEYDYGARYYDPVIGRFTTMDRYTEKYSGMTPYQYGALNPIRNIDVNGDSVRVSTTLSIAIPFVGNINVQDNVYFKDGKTYNQGGSDYTGNDPFVAQVGAALNDLSQGDVGKSLVVDLEGSTNNTSIINDSRGQGNLTADDGSQVRWNPNGTTGGPDQAGSTTRPSFIGLGHEFAHVQDAWAGTLDKSEWYPVNNADGDKVGSVTNSEKVATYVENQLRAEHHLKLREFYSPTASGGGYERSRILQRGTSNNLWIQRNPQVPEPTGHAYITPTPATLPTTLPK